LSRRPPLVPKARHLLHCAQNFAPAVQHHPHPPRPGGEGGCEENHHTRPMQAAPGQCPKMQSKGRVGRKTRIAAKKWTFGARGGKTASWASLHKNSTHIPAAPPPRPGWSRGNPTHCTDAYRSWSMLSGVPPWARIMGTVIPARHLFQRQPSDREGQGKRCLKGVPVFIGPRM